MSLIDENILATLPWQKRKRLKDPVTVKGMKGKPHDTSEIVVLNVYFPDASGKRFAQIQREFHVVKGLECGVMFGNDIISPENIVIDVATRKATIHSCRNFVSLLRLTPRRKIKNVNCLYHCEDNPPSKLLYLHSNSSWTNVFAYMVPGPCF